MHNEERGDQPADWQWPSVDSGGGTAVGEMFGSEATQPVAPAQRARRRDGDRERLRRKRRRRGAIAIVVAALLLVGGGFAVVAVLGPLFDRGTQEAPSVADHPGPGHGAAQVVVNPGDSGAVIGQTLEAAGVVASVGAFTTAYTANPDASTIAPGTYELALEMKASDAVSALLDPARRVSYRVTVPEGLTAAQTYERISAVTAIPVADLQAAAADPAAIGLPPQAGGNVEGWLFPATYAFEPASTATTILAEMVAKTVSVLDGLAVPAEERQRVLTIASVAEKEVAFAEEYPKVARVIENRLEREIPLGMDTINAYGLGKPAIELVGSDFDIDNPYNSRMHLGLPPTPISNPGEASIAGAMNPADGDWVYFITVDLDTGETIFTDSYDEFLAGKARYQEWLAANGTDS
ncbi:endolytic transglycosylase MltG [uncultured Cellulomonas sp.]|uniref:endolytic transglycosylase MltG n=1 Tax=uncultured Cellulomonas sp. TaxID=189682 RepID=UPI002615DE20|nr:endolytic transglycosylase MltG [uncultured Cellulomonas sp.]